MLKPLPAPCINLSYGRLWPHINVDPENGFLVRVHARTDPGGVTTTAFRMGLDRDPGQPPPAGRALECERPGPLEVQRAGAPALQRPRPPAGPGTWPPMAPPQKKANARFRAGAAWVMSPSRKDTSPSARSTDVDAAEALDTAAVVETVAAVEFKVALLVNG